MAHAAEVSRTTVTNALNGTGRMTEATRTRVRAVAADLGCRTPARTLALGLSLHSDRVWDFASVPYYEQIITSADAHSRGYGPTVLPPQARLGQPDRRRRPWSSTLPRTTRLAATPYAGHLGRPSH